MKYVPQKEPRGLDLSSPSSFSGRLRVPGHTGIGTLKDTDTCKCLIEDTNLDPDGSRESTCRSYLCTVNETRGCIISSLPPSLLIQVLDLTSWSCIWAASFLAVEMSWANAVEKPHGAQSTSTMKKQAEACKESSLAKARPFLIPVN